MRKYASQVFQSVGFRLLASLIATMGVVLSGFAVVNFNSTREQWTELMKDYTAETGELIQQATHHAMLRNRKQDVQRTIERIAHNPSVAGIRIFDKNGRIVFSDTPSEIGETVDRRSEACAACHPEGGAVIAKIRARTLTSATGETIFAQINPIENELACTEAACHAHQPEQTILGVLDIRMSAASAMKALSYTKNQILWTTIAMLLLLGVGTTWFIHSVVRRPVMQIYEGTRRVAAGDLDTHIHVSTRGELAELAAAFNRMTADLRRARQELTDWSDQLERKVVEKTEELGLVQRQILHMEKMASLGKLSATVAHELNNPLAGILTYAKLVGRELHEQPIPEEAGQELHRYLSVIQKESLRCGDIVRNLLLFARQSKVELTDTHLEVVIERSTMLVRHHLEMSNIRLETEINVEDDTVICDPAQIQQSLVALLVNACESIPAGSDGMITLGLQPKGEGLMIDITDTGVGIAADTLPHIFEPFFSTKEKESGVGLGLAVVYGIIQRHNGDISVDSTPGQGTTFQIWLPLDPNRAQTGARPARDDAKGAGLHG